jgi:hypothetical protein
VRPSYDDDDAADDDNDDDDDHHHHHAYPFHAAPVVALGYENPEVPIP